MKLSIGLKKKHPTFNYQMASIGIEHNGEKEDSKKPWMKKMPLSDLEIELIVANYKGTDCEKHINVLADHIAQMKIHVDKLYNKSQNFKKL